MSYLDEAYEVATREGLWVLVTASRSWPTKEQDTIWSALDECAGSVSRNHSKLSVMHGGARGGDAMAHHWTLRAVRARRPVNPPLVRKARWRDPCRQTCWPGHRKVVPDESGLTVCPMAGYHRNQDMVDELVRLDVPVLTLAFIHHPREHPDGTRGTLDCLNRAKAAKFDYVEFHSYTEAS